MNAQSVIDFFSTWGFAQAFCIILIFVLTELTKRPIYKAGLKYAEKYGVDKSVITWTISLLAFAYAFIMMFLFSYWKAAWNFLSIDWTYVVKQSLIVAPASMGVYEWFKKGYQASQAYKEKQTAEAKIETEKAAASDGKEETNPVVQATEVKAEVVQAKIAEAKKAEATSEATSEAKKDKTLIL